MSHGILSLAALTSTDAAGVGGKAHNLGQLMAAGFDVPPGFVLTTTLFAEFVSDNHLGPASTQEEVARATVSASLRAHVQDAARTILGEGPVAVRSSALGEDAAGASFAGQYETVLDVVGPEALVHAVHHCWSSAFTPRLAAYRRERAAGAAIEMAVVVQRMVRPDAAGVAFSANPVTGDRQERVVSAIPGLGDTLVSGEAAADEWTVRGDGATCHRNVHGAIDAAAARSVATLCERVAAHFGAPQDIEWAIADGRLWLLQARPITALPDVVSWAAPLPGAWMRNFRFGEWLPEPVTPLFASWLLPVLEEAFYDYYTEQMGIRPPPPPHVLVNGWYYGSLNFVPSNPLAAVWMMVSGWLPKLFANGRRALIFAPPLQAFTIEIYAAEWRDELARYQAAVGEVATALPGMDPSDMPAAIDRLGALAGRYFALITLVAGYAWKVEVPLARFYRQHLEPRIGGTHQELLQGLFVPARAGHDVQSLDWVRPTLGEAGIDGTDGAAHDRRARLDAVRRQAEDRARAALDPKQRATFDGLLAKAQRFAPLRDEQVSHFTMAWPTLRALVLLLGENLTAQGRLAAATDIFFLTKGELEAALAGTEARWAVPERRLAHARASRMSAPLHLGTLPAMVKNIFEQTEGAFRRERTVEAIVAGLPASPGRVEGRVRVLRGLVDFDRFQDGEILVAPATMPAWTPLFARAAAVVTDVGSVIAHAALVAREYGIPAVVGTGNATTTLVDGQRVVVDGTRGVVERA